LKFLIFRNLENITKNFEQIIEFLAPENAIFGLIWTKNGKNWPFLVRFGLNLGRCSSDWMKYILSCMQWPLDFPCYITNVLKVKVRNYMMNRLALILNLLYLKLSCDSRLQREFTSCCCIFKIITLALANQGIYFENVTTCSKHTLKTTVAT
jgi:hypothetical protein